MQKFCRLFVAVALASLTMSLFFIVLVNGAEVAGNFWDELEPMSTARAASVAVVGGKIYAIGGGSNSGAETLNEMYDPATNRWTIKTAMPQAGGGPTVAWQDKIYVFAPCLTMVYDTETDSWATTTPMPTPRSCLTASCVDGKIYLLGGFNDTFLGTPIGCDLNEMYDTETDTWATMMPIPDGSVYGVSAVIDGKIYLGGVRIYDPQTNTWDHGSANPYQANYNAGGATTGTYAPKRFYNIGGLYGHSNTIYDPLTNRWSTGVCIPTSRLHLGVAVVDDRIYAIGGIDPSGSGTVYSAANERYTPAGYYTPPTAMFSSPQNNVTYPSNSIPLHFTIEGSAESLWYSLDGQVTVLLAGNITLDGLVEGAHTLTVYARNTQGQNVELQSVTFSVVLQDEKLMLQQENLPLSVILSGVGVAVAVIVAISMLLIYKKHNH
ncbi:MAG: hypothetical protein NWF01_05650 [Candidatus Bathyarchaeota archaeon]|nr:hypothetical protein [Candidatus Bathyarchaeota archaeon]